MNRRSPTVLRLIAAFRLTKATLLIAGGIGLLRLLNPAIEEHVRELVSQIPVKAVVTFFTKLNPHRVELIAAGAFSYAALFIVEGTGLWLQKKWAEYLTITATASFLPFEIWEVVRKMSALRLTVLVSNVAILVYLIWRVISDRELRARLPRR